MRLITTKEQLIQNIESVENYLADGSEAEQGIIRDLIRKGKCLVAYKIDNETRFAPSRFLGYVENQVSKHLKSNTKDGRETNVLISRALETKLISSEDLENRYINYCENLGVQPSNYSKRRYWFFELEKDFVENKEVDGLFPEGKIIERLHISRERSSKVIAIAKSNFKLKHGRFFCQICKFDFEDKYGKVGADFIEAHHTIPVSEMKENHLTSPGDIAFLCANCHRMVHKRRPWLTMENLGKLLK